VAASIAVAAGDIVLQVVYDPEGRKSGTLVVGQLISTGGNVILHAPDGIMALDENSLIHGDRIELDAGTSIGSPDLYLPVDSNVLGRGGVAAHATGDIYLCETQGDLKLAQPQSWENAQASIHSEQGDVYLYVVAGAILDAWYEQLEPRSQEEADELDRRMQLTGDAAREAAETALRSEENLRTQLYHEYWQKYRDAKPGIVAHEIVVASIDAENDEIHSSQPHGLHTGDEVFFNIGVNLNSEDFGNAGRWEEVSPDYELAALPSGTLVDLQTEQTVRTPGGVLYRYVGPNAENVDLTDEDFGASGTWVEIVPEYDLLADYDLAMLPGTVTLHQGQQVRTTEGLLYRYLGIDLNSADFADSSK